MTTKYVKSWFARADEDLKASEILIEKSGSINLACFHAQQAAEKYLKGFLAHSDRHVRKIHDLEVLLEGCKSTDFSFEELREDARYLNQFYVESRYPDDYIEFQREDAEKAHQAALRIKKFVLEQVAKANKEK